MPDVYIDQSKGILRLTFSAEILSREEAEAFNEEALEKARQFPRQHSIMRILTDGRSTPAQAREVTDIFVPPEKLLRSQQDRYAVVVGSAILQLQARRLMNHDPRVRIFTDFDEAERWLLETD